MENNIPPDAVNKLSDKLEQVLILVAEGATNAEIGEKLFLSKRTIEKLRADLIIITRTRNTASLITFAFRNGLIV
ncbi:response regulator transcription factor [Pedobacter frigidisoli]|uniref:Response regulator transcription factor n=1 Tax=Pedobacter frigidisoli TaxID=2530455 RepID=A0A4R0NYR7_9SPHI|nr:LuxR C-terminal-related transcriptional regulator [Pedobacter frigidisoli]TCD07590.1 response regulator transcription factor [Pedobacter frigidisoli]